MLDLVRCEVFAAVSEISSFSRCNPVDGRTQSAGRAAVAYSVNLDCRMVKKSLGKNHPVMLLYLQKHSEFCPIKHDNICILYIITATCFGQI